MINILFIFKSEFNYHFVFHLLTYTYFNNKLYLFYHFKFICYINIIYNTSISSVVKKRVFY